MRDLIKKILVEVISTKKSNTNDFIEKAKKIHPNRYSYELVDYKNNKTPVIITCPTHGNFKRRPNDHLNGQGCKDCGVEQRASKRRLPQDVFIRRAEELHKGKYGYEKVDYKNNNTPVQIKCPIHGYFPQAPFNHLEGAGCWKCAREYVANKQTSNTEEFIEKARKIHGDKYNYDKVDYISSRQNVIITCPKKGHGDFPQTPGSHITQNAGCPKCKESKGEKYISDFLTKNNIIFIPQYKFKDCVGIGKQWCNQLPFDFFIYDYNVAIEYDGRQHFEPIYGNDEFINRKKIDKIKDDYCINNNIKLIRIPYTVPFNDIDKIISKELGLDIIK